jgi:hypothetical protein
MYDTMMFKYLILRMNFSYGIYVTRMWIHQKVEKILDRIWLDITYTKVLMFPEARSEAGIGGSQKNPRSEAVPRANRFLYIIMHI